MSTCNPSVPLPVVRQKGFEPLASGSGTQRSIQTDLLPQRSGWKLGSPIGTGQD